MFFVNGAINVGKKVFLGIIVLQSRTDRVANIFLGTDTFIVNDGVFEDQPLLVLYFVLWVGVTNPFWGIWDIFRLYGSRTTLVLVPNQKLVKPTINGTISRKVLVNEVRPKPPPVVEVKENY